VAIRKLPAWFIGDNQCNVARNVSVSNLNLSRAISQCYLITQCLLNCH